MSCYVNTVNGPVSPGELGITLMHETNLHNTASLSYSVLQGVHASELFPTPQGFQGH